MSCVHDSSAPPGDLPAGPEYSERGRGLQNDPITFPDETDSLVRSVQPAELVIPVQQSVSYFLPGRTLQPSPLTFLFTLPTLFLLLDLYSLLALFSSLNTMHYLLSLHSLTGLPVMLDLTTLFLLPDFHSLPAPLSPPDNMHSLLSLHNLTHLPAMLYLTYLEHSAFGEG